MIEQNQMREVIETISNLILEEESDELYFMRGNAYSRCGDWKHAMSDYCRAVELNPDSPSADAYDALVRIMEFYNKDMYNP